jgi:hypothetical protein
MGTVYKKTVTKPLRAGAKIIVRKGQWLAEWIDAKKAPDGTRHRRQGRLRPDRDYRPDLHRRVPGRFGDRSGNGHRLPG